MRIWCSISLLLAPVFSQGQLLDSLSWSFRQNPSIYAKLDTRNSFITNTHVKVRGIKVGLNYGDVTRVGIGYSWLAAGFTRDLQISNPDGSTQLAQATIRMSYVSPYIEYTYFRKGRWESTIPVQFDVGQTWMEYERSGEKIKVRKGWSVVYQPAMTVQYLLIRYVAVGVGIGYRFEFIRNRDIDENFTSPLYLIRSKIFFGRIWSDLFGR